MTQLQPDRRFVHGAIRSSYLDWGGDGPPLVLLHGLTTSAETWTLVARRLAAQFHIYALDQRGHGESDKPDHGYDYATLSDDILALFGEAGIRQAAVAGQSWGAGVALRFAAQHPDAVSHLMLVEGGYGRRRRELPATRTEWEQMLAPLEIYASRASYLRAAAGPLEDVYSQDIEEILLASVRLHEDGSVSEKLSRGHQVQILQAMWNDAQDESFAAVRCPTLLLPARASHPEAGPANTRKAEAVAGALAQMRNARVHWVENSVHDVQLHRPDEVAKVFAQFLLGDGTQPR